MPDIRLKGIKVVAVDDNADARELLKVILERSKAQTAVVSSGQAALEAIKDWVQLVLPDALGSRPVGSQSDLRRELQTFAGDCFYAEFWFKLPNVLQDFIAVHFRYR